MEKKQHFFFYLYNSIGIFVSSLKLLSCLFMSLWFPLLLCSSSIRVIVFRQATILPLRMEKSVKAIGWRFAWRREFEVAKVSGVVYAFKSSIWSRYMRSNSYQRVFSSLLLLLLFHWSCWVLSVYFSLFYSVYVLLPLLHCL